MLRRLARFWHQKSIGFYVGLASAAFSLTWILALAGCSSPQGNTTQNTLPAGQAGGSSSQVSVINVVTKTVHQG